MKRNLRYRFGISGIRGICGESISLLDVAEISLSFLFWIKKNRTSLDQQIKIAIGNDSRKSAYGFKKVLTSILEAHAVDIFDYGFIPTPTLVFSVKKYSLDAAIMITASHNPAYWNGFKFISDRGEFLNLREISFFKNILKKKTWKKEKNIFLKNSVYNYNNILIESHVDVVLNKFKEINFDIKSIQSQNYRIVLDVCNGPIQHLMKSFCKKLKIDYVMIHTNPLLLGEREIEPTVLNLKNTSLKIKELQSVDIGFAFDLDGDRVVMISESGTVFSEDYGVFLAMHEFLDFYPSSFVVNLSSSRIFDDLAKKKNVKIYKSKVGERYVIDKMIEEKCILGAEGNGGIIFSKIGLFKDPIVTVFLILHAMCRYKKSVGDIVSSLNRKKYSFLKEKFFLKNRSQLENLYKYVKKKYTEGITSTLDGIRVDYKLYWFHIRMSNTEKVIRIFLELEGEEKEARKKLDSIYIDMKKYSIL